MESHSRIQLVMAFLVKTWEVWFKRKKPAQERGSGFVRAAERIFYILGVFVAVLTIWWWERNIGWSTVSPWYMFAGSYLASVALLVLEDESGWPGLSIMNAFASGAAVLTLIYSIISLIYL